MPNNANINSFIQHPLFAEKLFSLRHQYLQHLQPIQTCHRQRISEIPEHDISKHSADPTTHQASAPSLVCVRKHPSSVPRPRHGNSDRSRLTSYSNAIPSNPTRSSSFPAHKDPTSSYIIPTWAPQYPHIASTAPKNTVFLLTSYPNQKEHALPNQLAFN